MAHGSPDWGASKPTATIYQLSDLGELAARLGSINTFDRRGDVVWMDSFEDTIHKYQLSLAGVGADIQLNGDHCRSGGSSCRLTTGNATGNFSYMYRAFGSAVVATKIGVELSFTLHPQITFYLYIEVYRRPTMYRVSMRYDPVANILAYQSFGGLYVDLLTGLDLQASATWHTMKIVGDFSVDGFYERVLLNNLRPDIQGIPSNQQPTDIEDQLRVVIYVSTQNDANNKLWIDDLIITQNEP